MRVRIFLGFLFIEVRAHLFIDDLDVADILLELCGRFIVQIFRAFQRTLQVTFGLCKLLTVRCKLCAQIVYFLHQTFTRFTEHGSIQTLALVLTVLREDLLLRPDELTCGNRFLRCIRVIRHLFRKLRFLVGNLPDCTAAVVEVVFLHLELLELRAYADDLQKHLGFLARRRFHKFRQINREFFHELVQELLAGALAGRVRDLEVAVFALALHLKPVTHDNM